ncbi:MAG: sugar phosphate isomerase/epimerase, partial [Oscillospiraceae bacterium]|nr:sugar phosphate isomerase/epimerase [Oscillospiraceae bacterium]
MRIGIDTFTIRDLNKNPYETLDYIKSLGFEGAQFGGIRSLSPALDAGELGALDDYAKSKDMYLYTSVPPFDAFLHSGPYEELKNEIEKQIIAAASADWRELHSCVNGGTARYTSPEPWSEHIDSAIRLFSDLGGVLREYGCRVNIETHGAETTFDILRIIEAAGADICGVCLDTANTLVNAEDPVLAAKRIAPYTHLTHLKDGLVYFSPNGVMRQGKPPGQGSVDFEQVLPILGEYSPDLPLSIEDHKWLFEAQIFDEDWILHNPDLTPRELGLFVKLAWEGTQKI